MKEVTKKRYQQPVLVEYGTMQALTRGSTGTKPDFVWNGGAYNNDGNGCTNNVSSGGCVSGGGPLG